MSGRPLVYIATAVLSTQRVKAVYAMGSQLLYFILSNTKFMTSV